jgi:transposase, IS6 family
MNAFKLRRFHALVILQCVRWYSKYTISYRQLEEMMGERGVAVDHTTIWRWIQHYAPQLEKEIRWYQGHTSGSWRVDETCIRVNGEWKWLFRAVDKHGRTVDFLLTHRRNAKAARRFLAKALRTRQHWPPHVINTDKNPAYSEALRQLKRDDPDVEAIEHRQAKHLNNRIEADHGPIKQLCRATLGFKSMKTAYATIKGFEVMRMIRKRQCILLEPGVTGEVRFVNNSSISPPNLRCGA